MAQESDGVADAYRAPREDDDDGEFEETDELAGPAFFVIGIPKLVLLELLTAHWYSVYWFYKHWSRYRQQTGQRMSPLLRAIFSFLFVHRLFFAMDASARASGLRPSWSASFQASLLVALSVATLLIGLGGSSPLGTCVSLALAVAAVWPTIAAQRVANLASGDPQAHRNSRFGAGGLLVALLGLMLWIGVISGLLKARP